MTAVGVRIALQELSQLQWIFTLGGLHLRAHHHTYFFIGLRLINGYDIKFLQFAVRIQTEQRHASKVAVILHSNKALRKSPVFSDSQLASVMQELCSGTLSLDLSKKKEGIVSQEIY